LLDSDDVGTPSLSKYFLFEWFKIEWREIILAAWLTSFCANTIRMQQLLICDFLLMVLVVHLSQTHLTGKCHEFGIHKPNKWQRGPRRGPTNLTAIEYSTQFHHVATPMLSNETSLSWDKYWIVKWTAPRRKGK
jgi:hypothetical protein